MGSTSLRPVVRAMLLALFLATSCIAFARGSEWEWEGIPRLVALGDVHGSFGKLAATLRAAGLIDASMHWKGGRDHLVLCGDLVDRGPDDRRVLDLVLALQEQSSRAGGMVHALIGNHEALTLVRDLRYVSPESYAGFAPDEKSVVRRKAWDGFRKAMSRPGVDENAMKAAFEKRFPPGYSRGWRLLAGQAGMERGC